MTDGFGNEPFGDEPFGGLGALLPGQRTSLRRSSFASTPRAYRSDSNASVLEPLEPAEPYRATAGYNEDTATKRSATLSVANPDSLRELADYVVLSLDVADDTGTVTTIPLGMAGRIALVSVVAVGDTTVTVTTNAGEQTARLVDGAMLAPGDTALVVQAGRELVAVGKVRIA